MNLLRKLSILNCPAKR